MKRTNEKDTSSSIKKTKTEHMEFGQTKLVMPARSSQPKRDSNKSSELPAFLKTPVETEPIVLSSDDEDDIVDRTALARSLLQNQPKNTKPLSLRKPSTSKATETKPPDNNSKADETATQQQINAATVIQQIPQSVKGKDKGVQPVAENKIDSGAAPVTINIPSTSNSTTVKVAEKVASSPVATSVQASQDPSGIDITHLDEELDKEEERNGTVSAVETSSEINIDKIVQPTPIPAPAPAPVLVLSKTYFKPRKTPSSSTLASEDLSEEYELQSDTEMKGTVASEHEDHQRNEGKIEGNAVESVESVRNVQDLKKVVGKSTAFQPEETDSDSTHASYSRERPVREGRSRVKTYNDIANSIDPEKLNYVSSGSDEEYNASGSSSTLLLRKALKKDIKPRLLRPSPSRIARPASVLAKFAKELTARRYLKTGFVYDTAMSYHATPNPMEIHPEDPRRIFKIFEILETHGLLKECKRIGSRRATKEEVLLVHNIVHYRKIRETAGIYHLYKKQYGRGIPCANKHCCLF
jgi:hypothetical protein